MNSVKVSFSSLFLHLRLKKMLEENNYNSIETIRKEYAHSQAEMEKKHQVS